MENRLEIIWGTKVLDEGFTSIPNILIRNYRKIGIEHGEWGLICTILTYKHDHRDPYPSEETLANDLQCSTRQIRKWIASLKNKGLILVGRRRNTVNKQWGNNVYNFKPMIDAALRSVGEEPLPDSKDDFVIEWENKLPEPEVPMGPGPEVPMVPEPKVPIKNKIKNNNIKNNNINNNKGVKEKTEDQPKKKENVVVENKLESFLKENKIKVNKKTLNQWRSMTDDKTIIDAVKCALGKSNVKNIVGYITGMLSNGYAQFRALCDVPDYILNQEESGYSKNQYEISKDDRIQTLDMLRKLGEISDEEYSRQLEQLNRG